MGFRGSKFSFRHARRAKTSRAEPASRLGRAVVVGFRTDMFPGVGP